MHRLRILASCIAMSLALNACAQSSAPPQPVASADPARTMPSQAGALQVRPIASGLDHPWAVAVLPGGDFLVTQPTLFLAGEAGPERATFTPQGGIGGDNARAGMTVNIYTQQSTGSIYRDLQLVEAML